MRSEQLFPDKEERQQVKAWLNEFGGIITQVLDEDGTVLYRNKMAFKENS
jgi:hypothetical protein